MKKETRRLIVRTFLFILYLTTGMVVFRVLESENESIERLKAQKDIEEMRVRFNVSVQEMQKFVNIIQRAADYGFLSNWVEKWSYTGSLFFSGTVITTIGYGHLAPATTGGRLFCILYALFGIPITWLMLTSLGKMIVEQIASWLASVCDSCTCCDVKSKRFSFLCLLAAICLSFIIMTIVSVVGIFSENWTFFEGFYFAFISLTTIGFGDYVPHHPRIEREDLEKSSFRISLFIIFCLFLFSFGLAATTSVLLSIRKIMEDQTILEFQSLYSSNSDDEEDKNRRHGDER